MPSIGPYGTGWSPRPFHSQPKTLVIYVGVIINLFFAHSYTLGLPTPLRIILLFFIFLLSLRLAQVCVTLS